MQPRSERNRGLVFTTAGVAILVAALLFGLTKNSNGGTVADWVVSIVTAIGGLIVGGVGLSRHRTSEVVQWDGPAARLTAPRASTGDDRDLAHKISVRHQLTLPFGRGGNPFGLRNWCRP